MREPIQFVTPLPPVQSGIAQYSRDLLRAAPEGWPFEVYLEPGSDPTESGHFRIAGWREFDPCRPAIIQLGNSAHHRAAFAAGRRARGIVVLHDVVLHHALLGEFVRRNGLRSYESLLKRLYGPMGERIAQSARRGRVPSDLIEWPLSEPYVRRSRAVIVHNEFARDLVLQRSPDATVYRVPMGVPLPRLIEQQSARKALGLPESAFIVASVTHMNPYKRIPVVLRAVQRLTARVPETVLVLAGSVAPGMDIERQAALLGIQPRLRMLGYVDDIRARLVARAADVCVNLRYPVTGETSASLLRLLGAALPVIVTSGESSSELADGVGLTVAPDRFEEELLVELLWTLATDEAFRVDAGLAARVFVEAEHSMTQALEGYRNTMDEVFGIALTEPPRSLVREDFPTYAQLNSMSRRDAPMISASTGDVEVRVVDELRHLRLDGHKPTLQAVARRMVELNIAGRKEGKTPASDALARELLEVLACPECAGELRQEAATLHCMACGRRYPNDDGIPNFVAHAPRQNKRSS